VAHPWHQLTGGSTGSRPAPAVRHDGSVSDTLTRAVLEAERHVAQQGWDQPPRLFALVRTAALLEREPGLRVHLDPQSVAMSVADPSHLTAVEQDGLAPTSSIESVLGQLAWGPEVDGVALCVERLVVPPDAERDLPQDTAAAIDQLAAHPGRQDVRILAAVLREGAQQCAIRQRGHDEAGSVAVGPDLVPGLVAALRATLE